MAEITEEEEERQRYTNQSTQSYEESYNVLIAEYSPTHPIRLGTSLSMATFFYEILNQKEKAYYIAKNAFDDAIGEMDGLSEENYREASLQMQMLRDTITLLGGMFDYFYSFILFLFFYSY